jgi:hypothetical protein
MPDTKSNSSAFRTVSWFLVGGVLGGLLLYYFRPLGSTPGDQPPIIIADGSVQLISVGTWTPEGNPASPTHYISDDGGKERAATMIRGVITGSIDTNCTPFFDSKQLTLTGGNNAGQTDSYDIDTLGSSGKVRVSPGKASTGTISPDGHVLDLTGNNVGSNGWWLTTLTAGSSSCHFDNSKKPNVLLQPY